jgi:transposase-like protein
MTHRRQCTAACTAQVVLERLSGANSRAELCREHQLAAAVLADWKRSVRARAAAIVAGPDQSSRQDTPRIAACEGLVGRVPRAHAIVTKAPSLVPTRA